MKKYAFTLALVAFAASTSAQVLLGDSKVAPPEISQPEFTLLDEIIDTGQAFNINGNIDSYITVRSFVATSLAYPDKLIFGYEVLDFDSSLNQQTGGGYLTQLEILDLRPVHANYQITDWHIAQSDNATTKTDGSPSNEIIAISSSISDGISQNELDLEWNDYQPLNNDGSTTIWVITDAPNWQWAQGTANSRNRSSYGYMYDSFRPSYDPVPEPGTIALVGLGIGALALRRRRKRQA